MIVKRAAQLAEFAPDRMGKVSLAGAGHLYAGLNCFEAGQEHKAHVHADQDKLYVVLEGGGEATVGEEKATISAGDIVLAPAGVPHGLRNPGPDRLVVLVVFAPPPKK